jgi:hypothetical protein
VSFRQAGPFLGHFVRNFPTASAFVLTLGAAALYTSKPASIPKKARALHALERLTFGPHAGDIEAVTVSVSSAGLSRSVIPFRHPHN